MSEISQKMQNFARGKPDFLKFYIFHEVRKAVAFRKLPRIVYHSETQKTMLDAFNEMCRFYGDGAMEYLEFEYWYIKFYSGNFDMDHDWRSTEVHRPSALQRFIFTDIVMNVYIWTSFKKYRKIEGNEMADYPEYEYWYMKFRSGDFDMGHDRSTDPKHRSFNDLPVHIFEKIIEKFNFADKLIIRQVSKSLRSAIDSWKPNIEKIKIFKDYKGICWRFDNMNSKLIVDNYFDKELTSSEEEASDEEGSIDYRERRSTRKMPDRYRFRDLKAVLGNSKLMLSSLEILKLNKKHTERFQEILNSMAKNTQIHVENFKLFYTSASFNLLPIIQHFNSEVLKEVHLEIDSNEKEVTKMNEMMYQLAKSEQLKNVKMLRIGGAFTKCLNPFYWLLEFPRVTIEVDSYMGSAKEAALAIETLVKSTVLEVFYIKKEKQNFNVNAIMKLLGVRSFCETFNRPSVRRYRIPRSPLWYDIEITEKMIRIERQ